jgi:hypothetical protein
MVRGVSEIVTNPNTETIRPTLVFVCYRPLPLGVRIIFIPKINAEQEPVKWSQNVKKLMKEDNLIELSTKLYNKGIYGDMLMEYYKDDSDKYLKLRFNYEKICRELKNEIWIIYYILDYFKNDI